MTRYLLPAVIAIIVAAVIIPGSPLRDAIFDDGGDSSPEFAGDVNPIPTPVRVEEDADGSTATPGPDDADVTAAPESTCHPIEVVVDGRTFFVNSAILQDQIILHAPIKLEVEDGEFIDLPGATVNSITTRRCGERDGKCDTLWLVTIKGDREEEGDLFIEATMTEQKASQTTWRNIYSGVERITPDSAPAEPVGQYCRTEST